MKIKILRTTVADKRLVRIGAVEDISDSDAKILILLGKAVAVEADAPGVAPVEELNTETASPVVDEETPRRGRKLRKA